MVRERERRREGGCRKRGEEGVREKMREGRVRIGRKQAGRE